MLEYFEKYKKNQAEKKEIKKSADNAKHRRSKSLTGSVERDAKKTIIQNNRDVAPEVTGGKNKDKGKGKERASSTEGSDEGRRAAAPAPILTDQDERFFERLTSPPVSPVDADGDALSRPGMPGRMRTPDISWDNDSVSSMVQSGSTSPMRAEKPEPPAAEAASKSHGPKGVARRLTTMIKSEKDRRFGSKKSETAGSSVAVLDSVEVARETNDLTRVLDDLNLSAKNNKAFSLSRDTSELVAKFALVLKDVVNGVPTAVDDLRALLDDTDGTLARNYEKLPKSMKKLVAQMPDKVSKSLAPELMAVAAEAGLSKESAAGQGGLKGMAKDFLMPKNLADLVTKPGAIVSLLKGIMNALKVRWPAFMGTNVIWSVAIFLLLFVLWYCHKRGREVRLEKECVAEVCEAGDCIEELPDDPMLPQP